MRCDKPFSRDCRVYVYPSIAQPTRHGRRRKLSYHHRAFTVPGSRLQFQLAIALRVCVAER